MPKVILFTDFDGTITLQDTNDYLTDNFGMGVDARKALGRKVMNKELAFRDSFKQMLESIKLPFNECVSRSLAHVQFDPGFAKFYKWAKANDVLVIVLSSGMEPIIRALLVKLIGPEAEEIPIVANQVEINGDKWSIKFHDDSSFGHDKSLTIKPYTENKDRPILLYSGDGISDVSAAKETDLLFAKAGMDLITYCKENDVKYREFTDFSEIHDYIQDLIK